MIRGRYFTEGSYGRQVALLYRIDDAHYRAALDAARGQYARAEASIQATRLQSQRYTDLAKINAVSRQEADNAQAAAKQAQADVSAQRAAVDAAAINLRYTQVRAPISGRIGSSLFTAGALVQAGQPKATATIQPIEARKSTRQN